MHIPDGFISPATYIAGFAVSVPLMAVGFKKLRAKLNDESLPVIASMTAFSFIVMMINIPIPGGTSGHAVGAALLAILFGPWVAGVCVSLVLLLQALVFGDGGITSFGINSFAMGFVGAFVAHYVYSALKNRIGFKAAAFLAGWCSLTAASVIVATALGIQPLIAVDAAGKPLFFPFDLSVAIPAIVGSHALIFAVVEGLATVAVLQVLKKVGVTKEENFSLGVANV